MPPYRKMLCANHFGADDFVGRNMEPIEITMTIKEVRLGETPAGKKKKPEVFFTESEKSAFFANTQFKKIAHDLRRGNTDDWKGAKIVVTSRETTMKGQPTTGMAVVRAWFDAPKQPAAPALQMGDGNVPA